MSEPTETETPAGATYVFPPSRLPDAIASVEKANRKLTRFGIAGQFAYTAAEKLIVETLASGEQVHRVMVEFTLNTPTLCYSGWEFVATLVHEEAGVIARTVPGKSLDGWKPNHETVCDHCNTNRYRKDTYVVRHVGTDTEAGTGEIKQVGSNCITAFLGIRPAGLWLLGLELIDEGEMNEEQFGGGAGYGDYRVPLRTVIRYALAASGLGIRFVPRSAAQYGGNTATVDTARRMMFDRLTQKDISQLAEEFATLDLVTEELIDTVIDAGRTIEGTSEYADNMRVAMASKNIDYRTMGLAASAISVWNRNEGRKAERKAKAEIAPGFLGEPGDKLTDIEVVITGCHQKEGYHYGSTETVITMRAVESGHQIKWFASGAFEYEIGTVLTLAKATVKKGSTWRGTDETVVIRAKLVEKEPTNP